MSRDYGVLMKTARDRVRDLLWDLKWHHFNELGRVGGVRYGARLLELRRLGWEIETRDLEPKGKEYRMIRRENGKPQGKQVKVFLDEDDAAALLAGTLTRKAKMAVLDGLKSYRVNKDKL